MEIAALSRSCCETCWTWYTCRHGYWCRLRPCTVATGVVLIIEALFGVLIKDARLRRREETLREGRD